LMPFFLRTLFFSFSFPQSVVSAPFVLKFTMHNIKFHYYNQFVKAIHSHWSIGYISLDDMLNICNDIGLYVNASFLVNSFNCA
jgi:hypothetical protein